MKKEEFKLSIALPKGYLFDICLDVIRRAGFDTDSLKEDSRKLFSISKKDEMRFVVCRPMDVPVYVERGACDIGFCGKDVLEELESGVMEILDLHNGKCQIIVATLAGQINKVKEKYEHFGSLKIATKYPNITKKYFDGKGMQVEIIKLYGSVELAPVLGIADEIVDITATGHTLRAHDLVEMEKIMTSTTRLVVNPASYRLKFDKINDFIKRIEQSI